jgi:hypothetical protein
MTSNLSDKEKAELDFKRQQLRQDLWSKAVDTQMHFNEMQTKTRQLGLSLAVGALALSVYLLRSLEAKDFIHIADFWPLNRIHVSAPLILFSAIGLYVVRILDVDVYHRMLRGAVAFGEQLEEEMKGEQLIRTQYGMTQFISRSSRYNDFEYASDRHMVTNVGSLRKTAMGRLRKFYSIAIGVVAGIAVLIVLFVK